MMPKLIFKLSALAIAVIHPAIVWADEANGVDNIELPQMNVKAKKVTDIYAGGQVAREVQYGLMGNMDMLDTPFSVTGYTSDTIQNQQARSVTDLMANDASIRTFSGADGAYDFFIIRGFESTTSAHSLNGLYGVLPAQNMGLDGFERAEIIKGPTTLLTGGAPLGDLAGSTNFIAKRGTDIPLTRISADYYGDGQLGTRADIGRRFGENKEFGIRINGNFRDGATAVDKQSERFGAGILALDYRGEKARIALDAGIQKYTIDNANFAINGIAAGIKVPSAPDASSNLFPNWTKAYSKDSYFVLSGEYDLTPSWTMFGAVGKKTGHSYIAQAYTDIADADGNTTVYPSFEPYKSDTSVSVNTGLRGKFHTGSISHQVAVAASLTKYNTGYTYTLDDFSFVSNIYQPVQMAIPAPFRGASKYAPTASEYEDTGVSLVDNVGFFDDKLNVILGVRQQRFQVKNLDVFTGETTSQYDKTKLSPSAGIVFKPQQNISIYANYMEGLKSGPTAGVTSTNAGTVFSPSVTEQAELGVKWDFGRITSTLALFQIKQPSGYEDSVTQEFKLAGEQRNRGVEFSTYGEVTNGVRLLSGITYINAEITKSDQGLLDGNDAVGVPKWGINIGGEWDVVDVPGLTLTGRTIYTSKQWVDESNTQEIPSWTRVDLGARYAFKAFDKPSVVRLNVMNVFDRDYWASSFGSRLTLAAPRTLSLSASFDF